MRNYGISQIFFCDWSFPIFTFYIICCTQWTFWVLRNYIWVKSKATIYKLRQIGSTFREINSYNQTRLKLIRLSNNLTKNFQNGERPTFCSKTSVQWITQKRGLWFDWRGSSPFKRYILVCTTQYSVEIQEFKCHSDFMWNHVSQNGTFWRDDEYVKLIH